MPIQSTREYYVTCEMYGMEGRSFQDIRDCQGGGYESHDRSEVIKDALHAGWLRRGRLWYCPHCRKKIEKQESDK